MLNPDDLQPLVCMPKEDLGAEYKTWLDLTKNEGRAKLAKAAIAIANHGGGYVVIGFDEEGENLVPTPRPDGIPPVTQDAVNEAIRRYATPEFHCEVHTIRSAANGVEHPVIRVPSDQTVPVMSKRDCNGEIARNRCYIRKPGPRSEEPQSSEDWRALINRCVRASREDMLESIRSIISGRVETIETPANVHTELLQFFEASRERWKELSGGLPERSASRFPLGYYEMGFALIGSEAAQNFEEIQDRLQEARRIRMTSRGPFFELQLNELKPYPHSGMVEAWLGRPTEPEIFLKKPVYSEFWRADKSGKLYTIRGYTEDGFSQPPPGQVMDVTLPVWRVGEATYFALRYAEQFEDTEAIAICVRFTGLNGRTLKSVTGQRLMMDYMISRTEEIQLKTTASLEQLRDNMVEVMQELLAPLYEVFSFFKLPQLLVEEELARMRQGKS